MKQSKSRRVGDGAPQRRDPYAVWLAEVMLQQTQAATVEPYYRRFLERFPTLRELADADREEVTSLWAGLGYYRRCHQLHEAARIVVNDLGGRFPSSVTELQRLPGIGRYTAGAIASIAFGRRTPILDGNVKRVLCRLFAVRTPPDEPATNAYLWKMAEAILPKRNCGRFNEALMDLGATVCIPKGPRCQRCPLSRNCLAAEADLTSLIPQPSRRATCIDVHFVALLLVAGNHVLLRRRLTDGLWPGMWEVPNRQRESKKQTVRRSATRDVAELLETLPATVARGLSKPELVGHVKHQLTHRRIHFDVYRVAAPRTRVRLPFRWANLNAIPPLPKAFAKVLARVSRETEPRP